VTSATIFVSLYQWPDRQCPCLRPCVHVFVARAWYQGGISMRRMQQQQEDGISGCGEIRRWLALL
jgi:hypothetical protein